MNFTFGPKKPEPFSAGEVHTFLRDRLNKKCVGVESCLSFDISHTLFVVALKLYNGQRYVLRTSNDDMVVLNGEPCAVKIYQKMVIVATTEDTSIYDITLEKKIASLPHDHYEPTALSINQDVMVVSGCGDMCFFHMPSVLQLFGTYPSVVLDLDVMKQQPLDYQFFRFIDCDMGPITGAYFCGGKFLVSACDNPGLSIDGKLHEQFQEIDCMFASANSVWIVQDLIVKQFNVSTMQCTSSFNCLPAIQKIVNKGQEFFNSVYVHATKNQILLAVEHNHDFDSDPETILLRCNLKTNQITTRQILGKVASFCVRNETLFFLTKRPQDFEFF